MELFTDISPCHWRYSGPPQRNLKAEVEIFANQKILDQAIQDGAINQVKNVGMLKGIVGPSLAMPDIHFGYGFCIGGVAAFDGEEGIVLPGGVGYDINCGVRLLTTNIPGSEFRSLVDSIGPAIMQTIPTGLSSKSAPGLSRREFQGIIQNGAREIVNRFGGMPDDLEMIESAGSLPVDNLSAISQRAIERGRGQVGTLGSGNHFIEFQVVEEIFDHPAATQFSLREGDTTVLIHTGSRGFGHQIASDYIEQFRRKYLSKQKLPDQQLIHADIRSGPGQNYLTALNAAANFAWANRHHIMKELVAILERQFHSTRTNLGIRLIYDQAHNIAKFEKHKIQGITRKLLVHRKGATRAFPPRHPEIPARYQAVGQPVIIPGSMGTASYVLKGTERAMEISFASSAHGAGRRLSRHKAVKLADQMDVRSRMKKERIAVYSHSNRGLKEEIPEAYKDIDEIVDITETAGLSRRVARMKPILVIKG